MQDWNVTFQSNFGPNMILKLKQSCDMTCKNVFYFRGWSKIHEPQGFSEINAIFWPQVIENYQLTFHFQAGIDPLSGHQFQRANGSAGSIGGIALGKFASLRRGKTIGRAVRERLSSSLYSSSSSGRSQQQQQEAETVLVPMIPELTKKKNKPVTQLHKGKQNKPRSKLCALIWSTLTTQTCYKCSKIIYCIKLYIQLRLISSPVFKPGSKM